LTGSQLLQPVNFTLNGSAFAVPSHPFDLPGAVARRSEWNGRGSDAADKLGVLST
jgi:hypothetical protein